MRRDALIQTIELCVINGCIFKCSLVKRVLSNNLSLWGIYSCLALGRQTVCSRVRGNLEENFKNYLQFWIVLVEVLCYQ